MNLLSSLITILQSDLTANALAYISFFVPYIKFEFSFIKLYVKPIYYLENKISITQMI